MTRKEFSEKYGQILLPLVTPFDEKEEIDYKVYEDLIEYLIKNDLCDSLIVTGTTGEASLCTFDERVKLMETAVRVSAGRKPVIAGTGCASTKETVALTKKAEELGIDLCMVVCPFYNKPTQPGVYNHYKTIAESVGVNILLYNIPIFVGINIDAPTVHELAKIPNIIGIKDEAGINPTQVTDYFLAPPRTSTPSSSSLTATTSCCCPPSCRAPWESSRGGAHIFGHEIRAIMQAFAAGENEKAKELFVPLYRFCKSCGQNGRILPNSIMRPAIELVTGIKVGPARSPLAPITDEEKAVLVDVLEKVGKLS